MTTIISEWVRAVVEKFQSKVFLAPIISPRTTSQDKDAEEKEEQEEREEEEEECRCFDSGNNNNNWMQTADNKQSCWSDLPTDILCQVAHRLPYWDLVRSAAVCKTWRLVIHKFHLPQRSTLLVPYLMSYTCIRDGKRIVHLPDHSIHVSHTSKNSITFLDMQGESYNYTVKNILLDETDPGPCASKYGWFLLHRRQLLYVRKRRQYYSLYNPFSNEVIQLPGLDLEHECYVDIATFTSPPTSPNCVVFVLCKLHGRRNEAQNCIISTFKLGDTRWRICKTRCHGYVEGSVTCVDGIVYCIFSQKNCYNNSTSVLISAFDIALQDWVMNHTSIEIANYNYKSRTFYLVESIDGQLLLAVSDLAHDVNSHYWNVYQFDRSRKEWTGMPSLGQQVLLLSSSTSIACATLGKDSKFSDMIFHLGWGNQPFTLSSDGAWTKPQVNYG